jgi:hypothetical protein
VLRTASLVATILNQYLMEKRVKIKLLLWTGWLIFYDSNTLIDFVLQTLVVTSQIEVLAVAIIPLLIYQSFPIAYFACLDPEERLTL